jgi:Mg2+/citrate symporter
MDVLTAIVVLALVIVLFLCLLIGFKEGVRVGMLAARQIEPPPVKNPISAVSDAVHEVKTTSEQREADKVFMEGLSNILQYNGDLPKEKG